MIHIKTVKRDEEFEFIVEEYCSPKFPTTEYIKSLIYSSLKLSQKLTASWYVYIKNQIVLLPGELSCPVDTFDSSSQDNLQSTRTSEVQVQLNHYAKN